SSRCSRAAKGRVSQLLKTAESRRGYRGCSRGHPLTPRDEPSAAQKQAPRCSRVSLSRADAPPPRRRLAKPDPLPGGFARLHGYLVMLEAFIFIHFPPCFLHCFFVPASEISDPSAPTQWRLAFANAAGEAARASAAIRANFIQILLGRMCLLAILARALGLASIELARTVGGAWPLAERL